jgi:hypothetical protein
MAQSAVDRISALDENEFQASLRYQQLRGPSRKLCGFINHEFGKQLSETSLFAYLYLTYWSDSNLSMIV